MESSQIVKYFMHTNRYTLDINLVRFILKSKQIVAHECDFSSLKRVLYGKQQFEVLKSHDNCLLRYSLSTFHLQLNCYGHYFKAIKRWYILPPTTQPNQDGASNALHILTVILYCVKEAGKVLTKSKKVLAHESDFSASESVLYGSQYLFPPTIQ